MLIMTLADYAPLDINPVFPGLEEIVITIIVVVVDIVIVIIIFTIIIISSLLFNIWTG